MVKKSSQVGSGGVGDGFKGIGDCVHPSSLSVVTSSKANILSVEDGKTPSGTNLAFEGQGPVEHPTSFIETLIHLLKGNIGSAVYAMGDAFKNAGLVTGSVLTLVLGFICIYSQHMLLSGAQEVQKRTGRAKLPQYAEAVELAFVTGPPGLHRWSNHVRLWINIFLCITQLGFCSIYFVFISDNVKKVMDYYDVEWDVHVHMLIALAPIMLSCWIRDLKYLVPLSMIANVCMVVGISITVYFLVQDLPPVESSKYFAPITSLPLFFGTIIYSFEGIGLLLPLQSEMRHPDSFNSRFGVLNIGMTIVTTLLVSMGFIGFLKYGNEVEGSLTLNLDPTDPLAQAVQLILSVGILFSYALQMYVPIDILWPKIQRRWGPFRWNVFAETIFRSILVLLTFILAEAIPHLHLFISLVGAVSSSTLALFFPCFMNLAIHWERGLGPCNWLLWKNGIIMLIGTVGFVTGTYISIEAIVKAL